MKSVCTTIRNENSLDYYRLANRHYSLTIELCITTAPNTVSVVNTAVLSDGNLTAIYGSAYQPYPETQPGYLIVSFPGRTYTVIP